MSSNYSFWKMAFDCKWVNTTELKSVVKTDINQFGEITVEEYKAITNTDYVKQ